MPSVPVPADPGWGEDPAWLDRDPMTAQEREARLDWLCEQQPGWTVAQLPSGTFRWTTPAGRSYDTEPTRYPI